MARKWEVLESTVNTLWLVGWHDEGGIWRTESSHDSSLSARTRVRQLKAASALGSLGGKSRSSAKTLAVRANGKLGGRPRKVTQ